MASEMPSLSELILAARQLGRDGFVARYPAPVLLCRRPAAQPSPDWSFRTQTIDVDRRMLAAMLVKERLTVSDEVLRYEVFTLEKTQNNPWRNRVSVGRARNNDVVLVDGSVSKLHAHFTIGPEGRLSLQDASSRNGTTVRGRKLESGEAVPVAPGDEIAFGRLETVLLDAGRLFDFIEGHVVSAGAR